MTSAHCEGSSSGSGTGNITPPPAKKSKTTILLDEVPDANLITPVKNSKGQTLFSDQTQKVLSMSLFSFELM